jgi:hypothetical protein
MNPPGHEWNVFNMTFLFLCGQVVRLFTSLDDATVRAVLWDQSVHCLVWPPLVRYAHILKQELHDKTQNGSEHAGQVLHACSLLCVQNPQLSLQYLFRFDVPPISICFLIKSIQLLNQVLILAEECA